ncbi:MAG TPA: PEP-CTERM sorting domain-containing protein, partial [Verrucomicrobiota bacterium]|nr:PEP-CTERM sorting domain-containing protein [Verrucomicrobiota bacterium]
LTQSINMGAVTHLGQFTIASGQPEGSVQTFSSDELDAFIQAYTGSSRVTFLLAAGNTSTGQFRVASREATETATGVLSGAEGDFAPYLSFAVIPEPSVFAMAGLGFLSMVFARRQRRG